MLTQEQIKNLKQGDPLIIHGTFERMATDGDICVKFPMSLSGFIDNNHLKFAHPSALSVVKPRYDPCRLFKKGDTVEMDTHGRDIAVSMKKSGVELGKRYTVTENENNTGYVSFIGDDGIEHHSMFFWLKLVTPVEELEPYIVYENLHVCAVMHRDEKDGKFLAVFFISHYGKTIARERAEAECARLNEEWRKEKNYNQN